jgi:hypothetical protein
MWIKWTSNLKTEDEINAFRNQVYGAKPVLDRITELLNEKEAAIDRSEINPETYNNPNWSHMQAYKNGIRAACADLRLLLTIEDKPT